MQSQTRGVSDGRRDESLSLRADPAADERRILASEALTYSTIGSGPLIVCDNVHVLRLGPVLTGSGS